MAFTGNLGRVQGAGWFHTSAASGTSVNISSLQPQLTPFVGDAVLFPNGDVRQITAVGSSTVTLGTVLFSVKGDAGIGNATLSNIDGDSTENGSTQAAIKGVMQAKNYYNLGVYDTYVSHGDGTGTVTRRTICLKLDGTETWTQHTTSDGGSRFFYDVVAMKPTGADQIKNSRGLQAADTFNHKNAIALSVTSIIICFLGTENLQEFKANLSVNPIYVQFKTTNAQTEKVIENQSIRPANQEENYYWHEERKKSLNLVNKIRINSAIDANTGNYFTANNWYASEKIKVEAGKTYCAASLTSLSLYDNNGNYLRQPFYSGVNVTGYFFTCSNDVGYVIITKIGDANLMLNEGSASYPYSPYNGKIIHEKDLSGVQLFPEGVNPAQTIGGDWEYEGSVITSDNTFYAYRRV